MVYSYTTAALVQAELQSSTAFSSATLPALADVTNWINEESAYVNSIANLVFGSTAYDQYIDYEGETIIPLDNTPIISVTAVLYNSSYLGQTNYATSWTTLTSEVDYTVYADRSYIQLLMNTIRPTAGIKKFRIQYTAGYATIPLDVQKLVTKLVALRVLDTLLQKNVNERNDGGSVSVGSISIIEPASYGVGSLKKIKSDIELLKTELVKGTKVIRAWM